MRKSRALLVAILLPCVAYAVVVALTDRVILSLSVHEGISRRAALAIRDNVSPFEKWGSKQFTEPYLKKYYDRAWYITQSGPEDGKQALLSALDTALQDYPEVDLYLLAHSNQYFRWVEELPSERRSRLRLVYNTGCFDLKQGELWLKLGAKAYVGHPGVSASPVFYFYFLRRWTRGATLNEAIATSNDLMRQTLSRAEFCSFGSLDATRVNRESEAFCHGNRELRFQGPRE